MNETPAYLFLCDQETEKECLTRNLMGCPQANAVWALNIRPGDSIYLLNFNTRIVRGPYLAASSADCYEPSAWRGKFPIQVRVTGTGFTKMADCLTPGTPSVLLRKRPVHALGSAAGELFRWIQDHGKTISEA